jgi:hypothetical protein
MNETTKIEWLKRVLNFKIIVVLLLWALPAWIGPATFLKALNINVPNDQFFMRMFGATQLGLGLLYYYALQNPVLNRDVIRYAVYDNGIAFITIIGYHLAFGIKSSMIWVSAILVLFFAAAFYMLTPQEK